MKPLLGLFIFLYAFSAYAQLEVSYPNESRSTNKTSTFKLKFSGNSYIKDNSQSLYLLSGETITVKTLSTVGKLEVTTSAPNSAEVSADEKSVTITVGTGPYTSQVVINEYLETDAGRTEFVQLTLDLFVSSKIPSLDVNTGTANITTFDLNGKERTIETISGTSSSSYNGNNMFTTVVNGGCFPEAELKEFTSTELTSTTGWISTDPTHYKKRLPIYSANSSIGAKYTFSDGNWFYVLTKRDPSITIINMTSSIYRLGEEVVIDWKGLTCYQEIRVTEPILPYLYSIENTLNNTGKDTLKNLGVGFYTIEGFDGNNWTFLSEFEVLEEPEAPSCDLQTTASFRCTGTNTSINMEVSSASGDIEEARASMNGPISFDVVLEEKDGQFKEPEAFYLFDGLDPSAFSISMCTVDSEGNQCCKKPEMPVYITPSVNGSVDVNFYCHGDPDIYNTILINEGNNCNTPTRISIDGTDISEGSGGIENLVNDLTQGASIFNFPMFQSKDVTDDKGNSLGSISITISEPYDAYPYISSVNAAETINEGEDFSIEVEANADFVDLAYSINGNYNYEPLSGGFNFETSIPDLTPGTYSFDIFAYRFCQNFQDPVEYFSNHSLEVLNVAPEINIINPMDESSVVHGETFDVIAEVYDPGEVTSVTATYNGLQIELTSNGTNYVGTFVADKDAVDQNIELIATDNFAANSNENTSIQIITENEIPTLSINAPSDGATFTVGYNITVDFDAEDFDGTISSISIIFDEVSYNVPLSGSSNYTFSVLAGNPGNLPIEIVIEDDNGARNTETIFVTIEEPINIKPIISNIEPSTGTEFMLNELINISFDAEDIDGSLALVSVLFNGNEYDLTPSSSTFSTSLLAEQSGNFIITITAEDDKGERTEKTTEILIKKPLNQAPTLSDILPLSGTEFTVNDPIEVSFNAEDDNGLNSVTVEYNGEIIDLTNNTVFSHVFFANGKGDQFITVTIIDSDGERTIETISVLVNNAVPEITLIAPTEAENLFINENYTLDFFLNEIDDQVILLEAEFNTEKIDLLTNPKPSLEVPLPGLYSLTLKAEDEGGNIINKNYTLNFIDPADKAPVIKVSSPIDNAVFDTKTEIPIEIFVESDFAIDEITVSYNNEKYTFTNTNEVRDFITLTGKGNQEISITVTDEFGTKTTETIHLTVNNNAPTISFITPKNYTSFLTNETINVSLDISDIDQNIKTAILTFDGNQLDLIENGFNINLSPISIGQQNIIVTVTDSLGAITTQSITILVNEPNVELPTLTINSPTTESIYSNKENLVFDISVEDPENQSIEKVTLVIFDVNNPKSMLYKKEFTTTPYEIAVEDLPRFPWNEGTLGLQVLAQTEDGRTAMSYVEFTVDGININSLSENEIETEFSIYPNPTSTNINIKAPENTVFSIIDITGKRITTGNLKNKRTIDVSYLPTGLYIIHLNYGHKTGVFKIEKL